MIKKGYEVKAASSISESQEALLNFVPDVILLDLRLPDGSGLELLKIIKDQNPI